MPPRLAQTNYELLVEEGYRLYLHGTRSDPWNITSWFHTPFTNAKIPRGKWEQIVHCDYETETTLGGFLQTSKGLSKLAMEERKSKADHLSLVLLYHLEHPTCAKVPEVFRYETEIKYFGNHFKHKFARISRRLEESGIPLFRDRNDNYLTNLFLVRTWNKTMEFMKPDFSGPDLSRVEFLDFSLRFRLFVKLFLEAGFGLCCVILIGEMVLARRAGKLPGDILRLWNALLKLCHRLMGIIRAISMRIRARYCRRRQAGGSHDTDNEVKEGIFDQHAKGHVIQVTSKKR